MPTPSLYQVENPMDKVLQGYGQAANTFASMDKQQKQTTTPPDKTFGAGLMTAGGGALAGSQIASMAMMSTGWGAGIGAGIGAMAYLFS
jgi:hypothetical protein